MTCIGDPEWCGPERRSSVRGVAAIAAAVNQSFLGSAHLTFGPSRLAIPAGSTASADSCPVSPSLAALAVEAPRGTVDPGQVSPRKNSAFPLRPSRLRGDTVGGDGFAVTGRLAQVVTPYASRLPRETLRIPRCRVSPPLPPPPTSRFGGCPLAGNQHHLFFQRTFTS